jgi:1,4-dihydroxy-6-naphthoate synthase
MRPINRDKTFIEALHVIELTYGHTPDADDAFMLYALTNGKLSSSSIKIVDIVKPMQELNRDALEGMHDISALSCGMYPHVSQTYTLLRTGVCMGFGYGPTIMSSHPLTRAELNQAKIAVPGSLTTACLVLRLFDPSIETVEMRFDAIPQAIKSGEVTAGLIIHEVQLTYEQWGLHKVGDLGEWWQEETGLPLPLGGNVVRRSLDRPIIEEAARLLKASIQYCLDHRQEALTFAMRYARGLTAEQADKFIGLYVNESTLDCGSAGTAALEKMYELAYEKGVIKNKVLLDFVPVA